MAKWDRKPEDPTCVDCGPELDAALDALAAALELDDIADAAQVVADVRRRRCPRGDLRCRCHPGVKWWWSSGGPRERLEAMGRARETAVGHALHGAPEWRERWRRHYA